MKTFVFTFALLILLSHNIQIDTAPVVTYPNGTECNVCHAVADIIRKDAHITNATINAIGNLTDWACCTFGIPVQCNICKIVVTDIHKIADYVLDGMSDSELCKTLGLCNATVPVMYDMIPTVTFSI